MTVPLGAAVHGKMLGAGMQLVILGIGRTLQSVHYRYTHPGCQVGILTVCLLTAAPSGITEDVHVRGPECKTLIAAQSAVLTVLG